MADCTECGTALFPGAVFCGACGSPVAAAGTPPAAPPSAPSAEGSGGLPSNVAGALAYFTIIPAILFLVVEPFSKDRFVRFHAFQSLFLAATFVVMSLALFILSIIINLVLFAVPRWMDIPFFAILIVTVLMWLMWIFVLLAIFGTVILLMYKAYNEKKSKLPILGSLAERLASK